MENTLIKICDSLLSWGKNRHSNKLLKDKRKMLIKFLSFYLDSFNNKVDEEEFEKFVQSLSKLDKDLIISFLSHFDLCTADGVLFTEIRASVGGIFYSYCLGAIHETPYYQSEFQDLRIRLEKGIYNNLLKGLLF